MTTFASELAGSSGRANTAPPGGGTGAGVNGARIQIGCVGALTATEVGPHLGSGSGSSRPRVLIRRDERLIDR